MKKYKSIVFDLGNVLFYWNPAQVIHQLQQWNPSIPLEIGKICQSKHWEAFDQGMLMKKDVVDAFSNEFDKEHLELFIHKAMESLKPIPLGLNLLEYVQKQGFTTYILSNLSYEFHDFLHQRHPFLYTVDGGVFSCFPHLLKPDASIFSHLLDQYHLDPEELFFIDDLEINIKAAKTMGIEGIVCDDHEKVSQFVRNFI